MTTRPCWAFQFDFLPPSVNHMYQAIGGGRKALTSDARQLRDSITILARRAGFEPQLGKCYAVRLRFTMPGWSGDIDGPVKAACDSIFGSRSDHRIVRLEVEKRVERGVRRTAVMIAEVPEP